MEEWGDLLVELGKDNAVFYIGSEDLSSTDEWRFVEQDLPRRTAEGVEMKRKGDWKILFRDE